MLLFSISFNDDSDSLKVFQDSNSIKNILIGLLKIFKTQDVDAISIAEDIYPNLRLIECYKKW